MKSIALITKASTDKFQFPNLWASCKTYYQEQSQYKNDWVWLSPISVSKDYHTYIDSLVKENPTVIGFSLYTWNEGTFMKMAEELHLRLPNTYIIFGGPQQDIKFNENYFRERPYVDLIVPGDAYGEIIFKEILDNISINNKLIPSELPYCWYPDKDLNRVHVDKPIDKRNFQWPSNPFRAQEDQLKLFLNKNDYYNGGWISLETSRGCPYRCSFCDWGGGTYTKTIKKPFATVLDEITWCSENQIYAIFFCDANFGLFDIDIEYAKHVAKCKEKYGYPKMVTIQSTKSKMKNLETIFDILCEAKLLPHLKIAVEDLNEHVLKNIDRVDFPFEEKIAMIRRIQKKHKNMPLFVEGILGLPGSSMETIRKDIDRTIKQDVNFPMNHPWTLLPETPAYDPEYRKKWEIVTVKKQDGLGSSSNMLPLRIKNEDAQQKGVQTVYQSEYDTTAEFVIGTYSYSPHEYIEMMSTQFFVLSLHNTGLLKSLAKFVTQEHNVLWGDFYIDIKKFLQAHNTLGENFNKVDNTVKEWVNGNTRDLYINWNKNFQYDIGIQSFILFYTLINSKEFYSSIGNYLAEKFNDRRIIDLAKFNKFSIFDLNYAINQTENFEYDWLSWDPNTQLVNTPVTYQAKDTHIRVGPKLEQVDWQEKIGTDDYYSHFIYRVCYTNMADKTVQNIERLNNV